MVEAPFMCFDYRVMTPGRFELAITAVKGQCHSPLDQGAKKKLHLMTRFYPA